MTDVISTGENDNKEGNNRYSMVNHIAKRAKVILSHDTSQLTNNRAIDRALEQVHDEAPTQQAPPLGEE